MGRNTAYVTHTLQAFAHEIENPLVAVAGFAKRLCHVLDPFSESGRYANIILQEALRLEETLNVMMKPEENKVEEL